MIRLINLLAAWRSGCVRVCVCVCVYGGAGHAQVSTAFILRGPQKVAAQGNSWLPLRSDLESHCTPSLVLFRNIRFLAVPSGCGRWPSRVWREGGKAGKLRKALESSRSSILRLQSADHRLLNSICTTPYGREEIAITVGGKK